MTVCSFCNGDREVPIEGGTVAFGGSASGHTIPCPQCRGTGRTGGPGHGTSPTGVSGGCLTQLIGQIFGIAFLFVLAVGLFAALVFVPRLFTKNDGDRTSALVAAATGVGFPANYALGRCQPNQSMADVPCDGPHDSEIYALVYIDAPPGAPYPARRDLMAFGPKHCEPAFPNYAASTPAALGVFLDEIYPNAADWASGVRQVVCGAVAVRGATLSAPLPRAPSN